MIVPGHLNFFSIEECGLYKHGSKVAKGLEVGETFELIYQWVKGKPIEDTIPWDPSTSRSDEAKCYCHDIYKCEDSGEFLLVLWKSDTNSSGSIWGAQAGAQTGESEVVEYTNSYRGRKMIWGRPCYYWVIPDLNTVVSIKVDHSVCDSGLFQEWVSKCITNRISHENKRRTETESGMVRFEFSDGSDLSCGRYSYRFDVKLRSINTGNAQMQDLASRVTHIVRRETIKLNAGFDERPAWIKLFDGIPHLPVKPKAKTRQIEVRAEVKPTATEIRQIIETFAKENRKRSDWDNVGFATADKGVVWVDTYRLHQKVNFSKDVASVFSAAELHEQLTSKRNRLVAEVRADELSKKKATRRVAGAAE